MKGNQFHKIVLLLFIIVGVTIRGLFFQIGTKNFRVNGDEAANFLQAQEIATGEWPLLFWGQPYQMPFEAYAMSLSGEFLSWEPFGVRIVPFILCLLGVLFSLLLVRKLAKNTESWIGYSLILIPSSYALFRQTVLFTPQHSLLYLLFGLLSWVAFLSLHSTKALKYVFLAGVLSGSLLSNHLLALSFVVPVLGVVSLGVGLRDFISRSLTAATGTFIGLLPYIWVKLTVEGAYQRVSDRQPLRDALGKIWDPIFNEVIPGALGINTPYYPDVGRKIDLFSSLAPITGGLFLCLIGILLILRLIEIGKSVQRDFWPSLKIEDIFLGATLLAIILMSLTGMELRLRYGLFIVWSFPFLILSLYQRVKGVRALLISSVVVGLLLVNLSTSYALYKFWRNPRVSDEYAFLPDLKPLLKYFRQNGISTCYSGWWLAYQVNVKTHQRIQCAPPFNDRFYGWPLPKYKAQVDSSTRTPFVEGVYEHKWLKADHLERVFRLESLKADRIRVGAFDVLDNIRHSSGATLESVRFSALSNEEPGSVLPILQDGELQKSWKSNQAQRVGLSIRFDLEDAREVSGVRIYTPVKDPLVEYPRVSFSVLDSKGVSQVIRDDVYGIPYPIKIESTKEFLFYPKTQLFYGFPNISAKTLIMTISTPKTDYNWEIAEVEILAVSHSFAQD